MISTGNGIWWSVKQSGAFYLSALVHWCSTGPGRCLLDAVWKQQFGLRFLAGLFETFGLISCEASWWGWEKSPNRVLSQCILAAPCTRDLQYPRAVLHTLACAACAQRRGASSSSVAGGCFQRMMGSARRLLDLVVPEWRREGNTTYLAGQDELAVLSWYNWADREAAGEENFSRGRSGPQWNIPDRRALCWRPVVVTREHWHLCRVAIPLWTELMFYNSWCMTFLMGNVKEQRGVFSSSCCLLMGLCAQWRLAVAGDAGSPVHDCCLQNDGEVRALVSHLLQIRLKPNGSWKGRCSLGSSWGDSQRHHRYRVLSLLWNGLGKLWTVWFLWRRGVEKALALSTGQPLKLQHGQTAAEPTWVCRNNVVSAKGFVCIALAWWVYIVSALCSMLPCPFWSSLNSPKADSLHVSTTFRSAHAAVLTLPTALVLDFLWMLTDPKKHPNPYSYICESSILSFWWFLD